MKKCHIYGGLRSVVVISICKQTRLDVGIPCTNLHRAFHSSAYIQFVNIFGDRKKTCLQCWPLAFVGRTTHVASLSRFYSLFISLIMIIIGPFFWFGVTRNWWMSMLGCRDWIGCECGNRWRGIAVCGDVEGSRRSTLGLSTRQRHSTRTPSAHFK